jgi:Copper binding periplasmic protein CusF
MEPTSKPGARATGFACAIVTLVGLALAGCGSSAPATPVRRYHLEGTVVSVMKAQQQLIVDNKDIPGFMTAMTMPYPIAHADVHVLDTLHPGDQITADVVIDASGYRLENIVVVKRSRGSRPSVPGQSALPNPSVYWEQQNEGMIGHTPGTTIVAADGKLYKWYRGDDSKPADVFADPLGLFPGQSASL